MLPFRLALLFTGHMTDLPDRPAPRFPSSLEPLAQEAIAESVLKARRASEGRFVGLSSGARGGDILFLEACRASSMPIRMVLPFSVEQFLDTSVRGTQDGRWEERFFALWSSLAPDEREILSTPDDRNPYDACNRRLLDLGRSLGDAVRLLAFWNGVDEGKSGGTASFVALTRLTGGTIDVIDAAALLKRPLES